MKARTGGVLAVMLALAACGSAEVVEPTTPPTTPPPSKGDQTEQARDIWEIEHLAPLEPGAYFIDPDFDPSTPLRVVYDIPAEGWSMWIGGAKYSDSGHVGVSITTVTNVVSDGCVNHLHSDPPIGPSVDELATALAALAPFQVTSPPEDVTVYGYAGKHLELMVPDLPVEESAEGLRFIECAGGRLKSWVAPFDTAPDDAFYGYTGPGYTEEFWIIDVEGTRLMIATERSADSPQQDLEELNTILESIRIEP
jgi:hypothetical protein